MLRDIGAWFLPLPPYSPDLNPIEMALVKLKTLICKAADRTYDAPWLTVIPAFAPFSFQPEPDLLFDLDDREEGGADGHDQHAVHQRHWAVFRAPPARAAGR